MDPFSHFLLGYLLGFGVWGPTGLQYVVAAAFAGGLPDADIALFPLAKRFPALRHRGISHSIVGVTVLAAAGTFLIPPLMAWTFGSAFAAGAPWAYFVALELGGLSHVLLDAMDHWSVPIFAPFSPREYSFDADRIANFGAMVFTVGAYTAMLSERGRAPLWLWVATGWILLVMVLVFFAVRLGARWAVERPRRDGGFTSVIPQANPFRFLLHAEERAGDGATRLRFAAYDLLRARGGEVRTIEVTSASSQHGPVLSAKEAMDRSYAEALRASWMLAETNRFAVARARPEGFEVFWYSLEMAFWGRHAGAVATVDGRDGRVAVRTRWLRPETFARG